MRKDIYWEWPDDRKEECPHGNWKNCAECDAEGERAMAELTRPIWFQGYAWGFVSGAAAALLWMHFFL